jgi:phage-related protein
MEPILLTVDNIKTGTSGFFDGIKSGVTTRLTPAIETIGTKLDTLKTSIGGTFDGINGKVTEKFADASEFFGGKAASIKKGVQSFFDGIPRLKVTMPEGVGKIGDSIKAVFGSMDEGTGILGFLGKVGGFLKPLMAPFELVVKTIMRPFTQILLSVIDFVTGFYQGFTSEDGTFGDKLKAGIEGGIKGIIKGFTEAIDLIFITLPAWLMEKLGFDGIAEKLRGFSLTALVDPAWEAVKGFFKKMFNDPGGTMMSIARGAGDMAENFIKTILRMILPDPGADRAWYDPRGLVAKAIPDSVYEYAGMNPQTGQVLPSVAAELAAQRSAMVQNEATNSAANQAAAIAASVNVGGATVINKGGNTRSTTIVAAQKAIGGAVGGYGF